MPQSNTIIGGGYTFEDIERYQEFISPINDMIKNNLKGASFGSIRMEDVSKLAYTFYTISNKDQGKREIDIVFDCFSRNDRRHIVKDDCSRANFPYFILKRSKDGLRKRLIINSEGSPEFEDISNLSALYEIFVQKDDKVLVLEIPVFPSLQPTFKSCSELNNLERKKLLDAFSRYYESPKIIGWIKENYLDLDFQFFPNHKMSSYFKGNSSKASNRIIFSEDVPNPSWRIHGFGDKGLFVVFRFRRISTGRISLNDISKKVKDL